MNESFVFHADYIEDLPEEYKVNYLIYTYNYGIHGKVPQLEGLEQSLWIKIQKRIDSDKAQYEISTLKKKINSINVRINNNKATENDLKNINLFKSKLIELNEINENNSINTKLNELIEVNRTDTYTDTNTSGVSVSDSVSVSVFDSVSVSVYVSVSDIDAQQVVLSEDTPATRFFNTIYNLFEPNGKKKKETFLKTDFKNAVNFLRSSETYKGFTTEDIERACKNFINVTDSADTYEGYKNKISFYSLVQKNWFYELINDNLDFFKIHGETGKKENHVNVKKYHDLCPECKTRTADWKNDKQKYYCTSCKKYFKEVIYE